MRTKEVTQYITQWLKNYIENANLEGFVIGVSGGVDSAVTSTIAAMTGKPLLCLEMPIHQKQDQITRAQDHIKWLEQKFSNVKGKSVDLTCTFDTFIQEVTPKEDHIHYLALANTRSRLRMATLYYYATLHHSIVVGTGNKIEDFGVGFYTKYGDGGVDVSPIADLMKSEIFAMAKELHIIDSIQKAKPTDGLWEDDRSDEEQIGATYDELEWAMHVHQSHAVEDFQGRQREVFEIYHKFNRAAQHKMNPIPICKIPENLK
ncbi:MAG: NAD(+) synthase [Flavobacteriales bacterium]